MWSAGPIPVGGVFRPRRHANVVNFPRYLIRHDGVVRIVHAAGLLTRLAAVFANDIRIDVPIARIDLVVVHADGLVRTPKDPVILDIGEYQLSPVHTPS